MMSMACGEDFLYRPILEGNMYKIESIHDGKLNLIDVVKCNEAIDVRNYNLNKLRDK